MSQPIRDRRRHVVYVTRNTEYHCRGRECVGVRERASGRWRRRHPALRGELLGGLGRDGPNLRRPREGLRLVINGQQTLMTSAVVATGRPDREAIFSYTSLAWSGEILTRAA
jgi:hypothetical protein